MQLSQTTDSEGRLPHRPLFVVSFVLVATIVGIGLGGGVGLVSDPTVADAPIDRSADSTALSTTDAPHWAHDSSLDGVQTASVPLGSDGSQSTSFGTVTDPDASSESAGSTGIGSTDPGDEHWAAEIEDPTEPTVVDGTIYVGSGDDDAVYALDAETGAEQWTFDADGSVEAEPTVVNGTVYAGTAEGSVYAIDAADGTETWAEDTDSTVRVSPTVADGHLYVLTGTTSGGTSATDGSLTVYDADTGDLEWADNLSTGSVSNPLAGYRVAPTVVDGTVYVADARTLFAFDAESGDEEWQVEESEFDPYDWDVNVEATSAPIVVEGTVYLGAMQITERTNFQTTPWVVGTAKQELIAFDADDGAEEWRFTAPEYDTNLGSGPAVVPDASGGSIYVGSNDGVLYALDATDGTEEWTFEADDAAEQFATTPTVAGDTVFAETTSILGVSEDIDTALYALDAQTGDEQWSSTTGRTIWGASPLVVDGVAYLVDPSSDAPGVRTIDAGVDDSSHDVGVLQGSTGHHDAWTGGASEAPIELVEASMQESGTLEGTGWSVDATYRNTGSEEGTHNSTLELEGHSPGAVFEDEVTVPAYDEAEHTFTQTPNDPGTYPVTVDGRDIGTLTIVSEEEPVYVSDADITDEYALEDDEFTVEATFENLADEAASHTATLAVDGSDEDVQTETVAGESTETVTFTAQMAEAGLYDVEVDGREVGAIDVRANPTFVTDAELRHDRMLAGDDAQIDVTARNLGDDADHHPTSVERYWVDADEDESDIIHTDSIPSNGELNDTLHTGIDDAGVHEISLAEETPEGPTLDYEIGAVEVFDDALHRHHAALTNETAEPGEPFAVELVYENVADEPRNQSITIAADGTDLHTETVEIDAHTTETVTIDVDGFDEWGVYDIVLDDEETTDDESIDTLYVGEFDFFVGAGADASIQETVDAASPGDVIAVAGGTYHEEVVVNTTGIELIGFDEETPVLDGQDGALGTAIGVDADDVTIDGFEIRDYDRPSLSDWQAAGVALEGQDGFTLRNATLVDIPDRPTSFGSGTNVEIRETEIVNTRQSAIDLYNVEGATIDSVTVSEQTRQAISLTRASDVEIRDSTFEHVDDGGIYRVIGVSSGSSSSMESVTLTNNTFQHNDARLVYVLGSGTVLDGNTFVDNDRGQVSVGNDAVVTDNQLVEASVLTVGSNGYVDGNHLEGSSATISAGEDTEIRNNLIEHSTSNDGAIRADGASFIAENTVSNATVGMMVEGSGATVSNNSVSSSEVSLVLRQAIDATVTDNELSTGLALTDPPAALATDPHAMSGNSIAGNPIEYAANTTDPTIDPDAAQVVLVNVTDADVSGMNVSSAVAPVQVVQSDGATVTDTTISSPGGQANVLGSWGAISVHGSTEAMVSGNELGGVGDRGILLADSPDAAVLENDLDTVAGSAIALENATGATVTANDVTDASAGVRLTESDGVTISENVIAATDAAGIDVGTGVSTDTVVQNNTVSEADDYGIWLGSSEGTAVTDNTVEANERGIGAEWTDTPTHGVDISANEVLANEQVGIRLDAGFGALDAVSVLGNEIRDTQERGVLVESNAGDLEMTDNEFIRNGDAVRYERQSGVLNATGNWWGDATGPSGGLVDPVTGASADGDGDSISQYLSEENVRFDPWVGKLAYFTVDCEDDTCTFDASAGDYPGDVVSYDWTFGDGDTGSGETVEHTYDEPGTYTVTLTAEAEDGTTGTHSETIGIDGDTAHCDVVVSNGDSIQAGIDAAAAGETVCIEYGTYEESVTIDSPLTLAGTGAVAVLEGTVNAGITIEDTSDVHVEGLDLVGFDDGVSIEHADDVTLDGLDVEPGSNGITVGEAASADVSNVTTTGGTYGVYTNSDTDEVTVRDSTFTDAFYGIYLGTWTATVENTTFTGNDYGVSLVDWGVELDEPSVTIRENRFEDSVDTGVEVNGYGSLNHSVLDSVEITDNALENNTLGVAATFEDDDLHLDARNNWWGATNGPGGDVEDPVEDTLADGDGDEVTEQVRFEPFLDSPPVETPSDPAHFDVTIDSTNAPVDEGDALDVTATIENAGDEEVTQTIELEDVGGASVDSTEVTLAGSSSETRTLTWDTEIGDAGEGEVTVRSEDDAATETVRIDPVETTGTVVGTVVDGETDDPIEGASVLLNADSETANSTTTDADGEYELSAPAGTYDAFAAIEYYEPETAEDVELVDDETVTQDFELFETDDGEEGGVVASTLRHVDGTEPAMDEISLGAGVVDDSVAIQLFNESAGEDDLEALYDLSGLGADETTEFEIELQLADVDPVALGGAGQVRDWTQIDNGDGTTNVTIAVGPITQQAILDCGTYDPATSCQPPLEDWPEGDEDAATVAWAATLGLTLEELPDQERSVVEPAIGTTLETNAQHLESPVYEAENATFSVDVAAPATTVAGEDTEGVFDAFLPDSMLDDWDVDDAAAELAATFDGDGVDIDVSDADGGVDVSADVSYSAGTVTLFATDPAGPIFDVTVTDVASPVFVDEPMAIDVEIDNIGNEPGSQDIELRTDANETIEATAVSVEPGATEPITLEWTPESKHVGTVDLSVWSENAVDYGSTEVLPEGAGYVVDTSLDVYDGDESVLEELSIDAAVEDEDVFLRLVNDDPESPDDPADAIAAERDLSALGVEPGDGWFEIEVQLANLEPNAIGGTAELDDWWVESNADGTTSVTVQATTLGTDVVIDCEAYNEADGCEPPLEAWPDAESAATHSLESTLDLTLSDLSSLEQGDATTGVQVVTDAQRIAYDAADEDGLTVDLGAPARGVDDQQNEGLFVATVPDELLDAWDVETTDEITVEYGGEPADSTVIEVGDGYRIDVDLAYAGAEAVTIAPDVDDPATFEPTITGTNDPVPEGSTVVVDAVVENVGDETGSQMVDLVHEDHGLLFEAPVVDLGPGEQRTVEFQWWTEEGDVGTHDLEVVTEDDVTETTVEVEELGFGVSIFPEEPTANVPVVFQATHTDAPVWDFDDGSTATGSKVFHEFEDAGTYDVTLTDAADGSTEHHEVVVSEAEISIVQLDPVYGGQPLQGVKWEETFRAGVFSEHDVDDVTFELDGETVTRDGSAGLYDATFDLGELDGDAELTITAVDDQGGTTESTRMVRVSEPPSWIEWILDGDGDVVVDREAGTIDAKHTPLDLEESFGITGVPLLPDVDLLSYELFAEAIARYTADPVGADVQGEGWLDAELFEQGLEGDVEGQGSVDSNLSLEEATIEASMARTGLEGPTVFGGSVEGQEDNQMEDVIVPWTIDPSVEFEGQFGPDFSFEQGTVQTAIDVRVLYAAEALGCGLYAEGGGDVTASFDVGNETALNPGGSLSVDGEIILDCHFDLDFEYDLGPYEGEIGSGSLGAQSAGIPADSVTVSPASTHGSNPLPGVPAVDAADGSDAVDSPEASASTVTGDGAGDGFDRLTNRPHEDGQPAIETVGDELLVAWSAADESGEDATGPDLRVRSQNLTTGEWSDDEALTDGAASDETPALAATDDATVAAWATLGDAPPIDDVDGPADLFGHYELAYAVDDGNGWSEPTVLTDTDERQFRPSVEPTDDGWLLAWESATADGSSSDVAYTFLDADGENGPIETIANATRPTTGPDGAGASLAYVSTDEAGADATTDEAGADAATDEAGADAATDEAGADATTDAVDEVVTASVDGAELFEHHRHAAGNVTSLTTADSRTIWANGSTNDRSLFEGDAAGVTELDLGAGISSVSELALTTHGDNAVLAYRAQHADDPSSDLGYRLDRGDGWIQDHSYAGLPDENLTMWYSDVAFADDGDSFHSAFAVQELDRDAVNDVFVAEHAFAPAYELDANASAADAGNESTIAYDLENVGDVTATENVTVEIENGTSVVETIDHDPIDPGQVVSASRNLTVDDSGTFSLSIDHGDETLATSAEVGGAASSLGSAAEPTTVVAATPGLSVGSIETELVNASQLVVDAEVTNDGGAAATDVPVVFADGVDELETVEIDRVGLGENATATATIDPAAINETVVDRVSIDTTGSIDETAIEYGDRPVWLLQPDLTVGGVEYLDVDGDLYADVLLANHGYGETNATVTVADDDGDRLGESTAAIGAATTNESAFESVEVPLDDAAEGTPVTVLLDGETPDANPSTTGTTDDVASITTVSRPAFAAEIVSVDDPFETGSILDVEIEVANPGDRVDEQSITLFADGSEASTLTVELEPGATAIETFAVETADDAEAIDLLVDSLTAQDATTVVADEGGSGGGGPPSFSPPSDPTDPASFAITDLDVPAEVVADGALDVTATVENVGGEPGSGTVELRLAGEPIDEAVVDLDVDDSTVVSYEVATDDLDPGEYELALDTGDETSSTTVQVSGADEDADDSEAGIDGADDDAGDEADDSIHGFGVAVALVALAAALLARVWFQ